MSNLRTIKKRASIPAALVAIIAMVMGVVLVPLSTAPSANAAPLPKKEFETCGGSVAISFDLSNSLSASDVEKSKQAALALVKSLKGSPYRFGIYTFASHSPAAGNKNFTPVSLANEDGYNEVVAAINDIQMPAIRENIVGSPNGGTNWEGGLQAIANDIDRGVKYDSVYFITDGEPTWDNTGRNWQGNTTEVVELDKAIEQVKRISDKGAKLIPVGIGQLSQDKPFDLYAPIAPPEYYYYWSPDPWKIDRSLTGKQMLEKITSPGLSPIILPDYSKLPEQMGQQIFTGCFQIAKNIIDADGNVIENPDGWNFDIKAARGQGIPTSIVTDKNGQDTFAMKSINKESFEITITERPTGDQKQNFRFKDARCQRYSYGQAPADIPIKTSDTSITLTADTKSLISCGFNNLPVVPVSVSKKVNVNTPQLLEELNNQTFDFIYSCEKGANEKEIKGKIEGVRNGESKEIGKVAVGTQCEIKEVTPKVDDSRMKLSTTWSSENTAAEANQDNDTYRFKAGADAFKNKKTVLATAENNYEAQTATIKLTKSIINRDKIPAAKLPKEFPVTYTCRYVPHPNARPERGELPETNSYFVDSKTVVVPRDGNTEIGPFPVGTQCSFEETARLDSNVQADAKIPGFSLKTEWNSNICFGNTTDNNSQDCSTNSVWIPKPGQYSINVKNTYTRELASVEIEKTVSGDASDLTNSHEFSFNLRCEDSGVEVYSQDNIVVKKDGRQVIEDIPVDADCTLSEKQPEQKGVDFVVPAPSHLRASTAGDIVKVVVDNTAKRQVAPISVQKKVNKKDTFSPEISASIDALTYNVVAECTVPGEETPRKVLKTVSDNQTVDFGSFPVGTTCSFKELTEAPAGAEMNYKFADGPEVTIEDSTPINKVLTNTFENARGELKVTKKVPDGDMPQALVDQIPSSFTVNVACSITGNHSITLQKDEQKSVPGVVAGDSCTLSEEVTPITGAIHHKHWIKGELLQVADSTDITIDPNGSNSIRLENHYQTDDVSLELTKRVRVIDQAGNDVNSELKNAVVRPEQPFLFRYRCEINGQVVAENTLRVEEINAGSAKVPRGSTCTVEEDTSSVELPTASLSHVEFSVDGTKTNDKASVAINSDHNRLDATNTFTLKTGSFNLKKKVDGEGVSTIHEDRRFELAYRCTLGDWKKEGTITLGRFDSAELHSVKDIPVGASCEIIEDSGKAQEPNAQVTARWTHTDSTNGWGDTEAACENHAACEVDPKNEFATTVIITGNEKENFQGTFVIWNTYTYDKTKVEINKALTNDGPELAGKDNFAFTLVCTDPRFAGSDLADKNFIPDPTITVALNAKGQSRASYQVAGERHDSVEVPVGYDCTVTENPIALYDAKVTTQFSGPAVVENTAVQRASSNSASARFTTVKQEENGTQKIQVTNDYIRPRADVMVHKTIAKPEHSVDKWLLNTTYRITYVCQDPYTDRLPYSGYVDVQADAAQSTPILADPTTGVKIPASAICKFSENTEGHLPAEAKGAVDETNKVTELAGEHEKRFYFTPEIEDVVLSESEPTRIEFTNSYVMPQRILSLQKYVEGDPGHAVIAPETTFRFSYTCTMPHLFPNQPNPISQEVGNKVASGVIDVREGDAWISPEVPIGTSCTIKEEDDATLRTNLENNALRMVPTYLFPTERAGAASEPVIPPSTGRPIYNGTDPRLQMPESGIELNDAHSHTVVINNVYTTDAEINIAKVNADNSPMPGAHFAVYGLGENGQRNEVAEVADVPVQSLEKALFAVRLRPGSYELVETQAPEGAQLLPKPWRFDVKAANAGAMGDLEVTLDHYDADSGLITVEHPQGKPWLIKVANVSASTLPLTGSNGYLRWLLAGAAGLLVAAALWLVARRKR
ncbi:SpaA fimbrial minor subunit SpaC [Corynebacterium rouxii]|uniref:SpaA fimbrial minor subunit SpaC n=1 Tax=Corynebacterium rouxii TaxID=2719119 RepID=UPI00313AA47F